VDETPSFESVKKDQPRGGLSKVFSDRDTLRQMAWAGAYFMPVLVPYYLIMTFMPTYLKEQGHYSAATSLWIIAIAGVLQLPAIRSPERCLTSSAADF
jgi:MHS family proline/betaine transporter-like MFS transporter